MKIINLIWPCCTNFDFNYISLVLFDINVKLARHCLAVYVGFSSENRPPASNCRQSIGKPTTNPSLNCNDTACSVCEQTVIIVKFTGGDIVRETAVRFFLFISNFKGKTTSNRIPSSTTSAPFLTKYLRSCNVYNFGETVVSH